MYVIKNNNGAFVEQNTNNKELNYVFTTVEKTQHYTKRELKSLYDRFKNDWNEKEFEVYKINFSISLIKSEIWNK